MITSCPECNGKVSSEAETCPHCGYRQKPTPPAATPPQRPPTPPQPVYIQAPPPAPPQPAGGFLDPRSNMRSLGGCAVILLVLGVIGFVVWQFVLPASIREGTGRFVSNATGQPQTLKDEVVDVPAGTCMYYGFQLYKEVKVTLEIDVREGSAVDVYLMTSAQKETFEKANKKLFGGEFEYTRALSKKSVRTYTDSTVLPAGEWWFIIQSNETVPLFGSGKKTVVKIKIIADP